MGAFENFSKGDEKIKFVKNNLGFVEKVVEPWSATEDEVDAIVDTLYDSFGNVELVASEEVNNAITTKLREIREGSSDLF
jgi:hypothetical protein